MDAVLESASSGRSIKFTPERLDQIRNLVERGKTREEIAELVGSTVGSLQVTCSRLGISLRPPRPKPVIVSSQPPQRAVTPACSRAQVSLTVAYNNRTRTSELQLTEATLIRLILEANMRGMTLAEYLAERINQISTNGQR